MADDTVLFPIRLSTFERADERTLIDASRPGIPDNFLRTTILLFIKFTIDPPQLANAHFVELRIIVRTHSGSLQSSFSPPSSGNGGGTEELSGQLAAAARPRHRVVFCFPSCGGVIG